MSIWAGVAHLIEHWAIQGVKKVDKSKIALCFVKRLNQGRSQGPDFGGGGNFI